MPDFPRILAALLLCALLAPPAPVRAEDGPTDPQARIQRMVDDLMPEAAALRGLAWKGPVKARLVTRLQLRGLLEQQLDRDITPAEWGRDDRILHRLGMLRPGEDLRTLLTSMFEASVAGLYDPIAKEMYVVSGYGADGMKPTIFHELIHALDDQHLDLEKLEKPFRDNDPDRVFALRCVFEGGAEYARRVYMNRHPEVARAFYRQQNAQVEMQREQLAMMRRVPTHMQLPNMLHYRSGPNFVTHAVGDDFPGGMQKLFADLPTTQEQCLYPYKWLGPERDYPRKLIWGGDFVQAMGAGWSKVDEHSVGELDLAVYLDFFLGDKEGRLDPRALGHGEFVNVLSSRAAQGWDAGRAYYLESPEKHIVVMQAYAFDSEAEAREGARFIAAALHKANGKAWKGDGWTDTGEKARHYGYVGKHGRGRIAHRGREVLVLDGIAAGLFERLWAVLAKTRFEKDPRDRGDEAADPFEGCAVVDRKRGLGLKLPGDPWTAEEERDRSNPLGFARAKNGSVYVLFHVLDHEFAHAGLPEVGKMVLGNRFRERSTAAADLMGVRGIVHPIAARPGRRRRLYIASDAARTYVVWVGGRRDELKKLEKDIALLLAGVRPTPATAGATPATPDAGLRSIPGY